MIAVFALLGGPVLVLIGLVLSWTLTTLVHVLRAELREHGLLSLRRRALRPA